MQKIFTTTDHTVNFVMHGTSNGGFNDKYSDPATARRNMTKLGRSFGSTSATLIVPEMGARVVVVGPEDDEVHCDGLITTNYNHALLLRPADCIPIVIYVADKPLVALVHGSRSGLDNDIIANAVQQLTKLGMQADGLHVYIGPSIKQSSYVLPVGVAEKLKHHGWAPYVKRDNDTIQLNIAGFARAELERLGVKTANISVSAIDTATNSEYYSNYQATRYGKEQGRNGVAVSMSLL